MAFLNVYAARLGASGLQIGLLTAGPAVVNLLVSLPAGSWLEGRPLIPITFWTSLASRFLYVLLIFLPWLFGDRLQISVMIWLTLLLSFPAAILAISFNASTDTVNDVLARINDSAAGVTARYDSINDRFLLTNKSTGDVGIALEDVTGNFLSATGLSSGTLSRGKNLLYAVNGGSQMVSPSNTIPASASPVPGLSVTALKVGTTTVEVATDTTKIKTAITDFITEYNKVQVMIDTETASSTDATSIRHAPAIPNATGTQ